MTPFEVRNILVIMERLSNLRLSVTVLFASAIPLVYYALNPSKKKEHYETFERICKETSRCFGITKNNSALASFSTCLESFAPNGIQYSYKSLESCAIILRMGFALHPLLTHNNIIKEFFIEIDRLLNKGYKRDSFVGKTVVCFEGLKGSGKSTMGNSLVNRTGGIMYGFPKKLDDIREIISSIHDPAMKAAFHHIVNYFMANDIINSSEKTAYLSDYYHCTNAAATSLMSLQESDLANVPSSAFEWPLDLPMPSLIVFLAVSTDVRLSRSSPVIDKPDEMERLVVRDSFRQAAYSYIFGPNVVAIDGSGSVDEVTSITLEACYEYGVDLYALCKQPSPVKLMRKSSSKNKRISMGVYGSLTDSAW